MKQGKRPTRAQKRFIQDKKLNSRNWLVTKDTPSMMEIVHRDSGSIKRYNK